MAKPKPQNKRISADVHSTGYDEDELRPLSIGRKDYLVLSGDCTI